MFELIFHGQNLKKNEDWTGRSEDCTVSIPFQTKLTKKQKLRGVKKFLKKVFRSDNNQGNVKLEALSC